jgi:hypothetical protein
MKPTTVVTALPEDEVDEFLERVGKLKAYQSGKLTCEVCGEPLLANGIGACSMVGDTIVFACAKLNCLQELGKSFQEMGHE